MDETHLFFLHWRIHMSTCVENDNNNNINDDMIWIEFEYIISSWQRRQEAAAHRTQTKMSHLSLLFGCMMWWFFRCWTWRQGNMSQTLTYMYSIYITYFIITVLLYHSIHSGFLCFFLGIYLYHIYLYIFCVREKNWWFFREYPSMEFVIIPCCMSMNKDWRKAIIYMENIHCRWWMHCTVANVNLNA